MKHEVLRARRPAEDRKPHVVVCLVMSGSTVKVLEDIKVQLPQRAISPALQAHMPGTCENIARKVKIGDRENPVLASTGKLLCRI